MVVMSCIYLMMVIQ